MDSNRFDKFSERARKVLSLAQEEAQRHQHHAIGTEHLLLGLVREGEGVAAQVLINLGVDLSMVRSAIELRIERGDRVVPGEVGLTPGANKVIELAEDEARRLKHDAIGTEHLLLGLVREDEGIAAGVLHHLGVTLEKVRAATIYILSHPSDLQKMEIPASLQQGFELLGDRYRFPVSAGQGGIVMFSVGWDTHLNRTVIIQVVLQDVDRADPRLVTRLQQKVKAASSLQHPNIVQVYDSIQSNGNYYIVREPFGGTDLRRYLRSRGTLAVDQAISIAHDVARGLGAAHDRGMVHGNVNPQHILVGRDISIKLNGLGYAGIYKEINAQRQKTTGMMPEIGVYDAPELARGEMLTPTSDVYALGMVLYQMLTGRTPFDRYSPLEVAMQETQDPLASPRLYDPNIPPDLEAVIMRCLEKVPENRFRDGHELADALERL